MGKTYGVTLARVYDDAMPVAAMQAWVADAVAEAERIEKFGRGE